jgi:hypothetical protein
VRNQHADRVIGLVLQPFSGNETFNIFLFIEKYVESFFCPINNVRLFEKSMRPAIFIRTKEDDL